MSHASDEMIPEEESSDDSEVSYVYCSYPLAQPSEMSRKDAEIAELHRKITVLKHERDTYKRQAEVYGKMIATEKKQSNPVTPSKKRWVSMANKSDWF